MKKGLNMLKKVALSATCVVMFSGCASLKRAQNQQHTQQSQEFKKTYFTISVKERAGHKKIYPTLESVKFTEDKNEHFSLRNGFYVLEVYNSKDKLIGSYPLDSNLEMKAENNLPLEDLRESITHITLPYSPDINVINISYKGMTKTLIKDLQEKLKENFQQNPESTNEVLKPICQPYELHKQLRSGRLKFLPKPSPLYLKNLKK